MGINDDLFSSQMFAARGLGDPLVGTRIDEYRLDALLGSGGMARVYRAVDVNLDRSVAIKVIDTPYQTDAEYARRFKREAQAIAQLEHPHIVRLYRYGQAGELFYMAMQFVRGVNLSELLQMHRRDGALVAPAEAARVIREVGDALDYAHSMGVIHRDVKSSNIIINQQGRAVLVDFGLAMLDGQGPGGEAFGSPHYLAPEQAAGGRITPQTDLYSLGVILYELLTGQRPFSAPDPITLAQKHLQEEPPAPSALRPEISPAVERVILKALSKSPRGRYTSGQALADALERALLEEPFPTGAALLPLAELVRRQMAVGAAPAPAPVQAVPEPSYPTQTQLSWDERHRRSMGSTDTLPAAPPVAARRAARPAATPRRRNILTSPAIIALLAVLLLCLGASVLAAANEMRVARLRPSATEGVLIGAGEALTSTPPPALPTGSPFGPFTGAPAQTGVIPNTGDDVTPAFTATSAVINPAPTITSGLLPTVIVVTITAAPGQPTAPAATQPAATVAPPQSTATKPPPPARTVPPPTATLPPPTASLAPTATLAPPTDTPVPPTETPAPTATTAVPVLPVDPVYRISIARRDANEGWMVILNTGSTDLPLANLRIEGKKTSLSGSDWGAESLPPGGCLVALAEKRSQNGRGPDTPCGQVGQTVLVDNPSSGIFKEEITVWFNGAVAGSCAKDQEACPVTLP